MLSIAPSLWLKANWLMYLIETFYIVVSRIATKKIDKIELFSMQKLCRIMTQMLQKPHEYSINEIDAALDLASNGVPIKEIASVLGLSILMFQRLLQKDPILASRFKQARETGFMTRAESLRELARSDEIPDTNKLKLVLDTEKWLLSKMHPAIFGDRIAVQVETVDVSGALDDAKKRAGLIDITPQTPQLPDPFAE